MDWAGKNVVITGAAGFMGSYLCEALIRNGASVTALDNFTACLTSNVESIKDKIQVVNCDICKENLKKYTNGRPVIFHLAAIANPRSCKENFNVAFEVNVEGTKYVLDAAKDCERFIFLSAAATYGNPSYIPIDEKHPLNGRDPYAISKIMAEYLCANYYQNYGIPAVIVRNFSTFGPRQTPAYIIPTLITQALKQKKLEIWNPKPTRDFMYIDNTIDALLKIAESEALIGETVNIGSGVEVKIGDLTEKIAKMFGGLPVTNLNKEVVGSERLVCDNTKLKKMTGWETVVSFEEGLKRTCEWFKQVSMN